MRSFRTIVSLLFLLALTGCSHIQETSKTIWGSSTRTLEEARADAISRTYLCTFEECYDAILSMGRSEHRLFTEVPDKEEPFEVFIKDPIQSHIIVMGVAGQVDTTEVGIFFARESAESFRLEITSLSTSAKRKVAEVVFNALDTQFIAID